MQPAETPVTAPAAPHAADPVEVEECPRQDSNLRPCLRRAVLYPLSYGGSGRPERYQSGAITLICGWAVASRACQAASVVSSWWTTTT